MNKQVVIASDSTCDLSPELIEHYQVKILPLTVILGGEHYQDGVDIDPEKIYAHYSETGELPKTAAANIADLTEFFKKHTEGGKSLVYFSISSEMSSSCNNAKIAAEAFEDVYVVDTRNLSTGGGLLVLSAAEMAAKGMAAKEIADVCTELTSCVDASFIIDDLEFLHKGGRCSALAALGANLLHLKPCIGVKHGAMGVTKKYRGRFSVVLAKYITDQLGDGSDLDLTRVFITHAGCDDAVVQACADQVKSLNLFDEVLITRAGCTVSAHCGRNTLGVLFIRKTAKP